MPVSITVRNVPDDTRNELAARAARSGRSLQEYLRAQLIGLAEREDMAAWVARVRDRVEREGTHVSAETIVNDIHAGRR